MKKWFLLPLVLTTVISLSACEIKPTTNSSKIVSDIETTANTTNVITEKPSTTESFIESAPKSENSIVFDNLEISIDKSKVYSTMIDNQFSDLDGSNVVALPLNITNLSSETNSINMFYLKSFGSKGTELENVYYYFDDGKDIFKDIRSGATLNATYYMLYDGDGTYYLSFNSFSESKEIPINITTTE